MTSSVGVSSTTGGTLLCPRRCPRVCPLLRGICTNNNNTITDFLLLFWVGGRAFHVTKQTDLAFLFPSPLHAHAAAALITHAFPRRENSFLVPRKLSPVVLCRSLITYLLWFLVSVAILKSGLQLATGGRTSLGWDPPRGVSTPRPHPS